MLLKRKSEALKSIPMLSDLSKTHLQRIAGVSSERTRKEGDILARQGEPGTEMFLILEGRAVVQRDGKPLARLSANDCFGEMSLIDYEPRSATVVAETPVTLLVLHTRPFHRLIGESPELGRSLLRVLSHRLRIADKSLANLS